MIQVYQGRLEMGLQAGKVIDLKKTWDGILIRRTCTKLKMMSLSYKSSFEWVGVE